MKVLETKIPPPLVLLASLLLIWLLSRVSFAAAFDFNASQTLALVLLLAGIAIAIAGVLEFRSAKTTVNPLDPELASSLVKTGIFRYTRNPMYLGMLLVSFAAVIFFGNWLSLLGSVFLYSYLTRFQIIPEERAMQNLFGPVFEEYRKTVRRWL